MTNLPDDPKRTPEPRPSRTWTPLTTLLTGLLAGLGAGLLGTWGLNTARASAPIPAAPDSEVPPGPPARGDAPHGVGVSGPRPAPPPVAAKAAPRTTPIQAVLLPAPAYPPIARLARIEGTVDVTVRVDEEGVPSTLTTAGNNKALEKAALEAAENSRFLPATRGGRAVPGNFQIRYDFKLQPNRS